MARIRSIKPEFFKHLELQELECSNPGQHTMLVYAGLWTQCDKNGVFLYNCKVLKNEVLPYMDFDMKKTLSILEENNYFIKYSSGGREYGFIPKFEKYQFPTKNEKDNPAKYPLPPDEIIEHSQELIETFPGTSQDVPKNHTGNHTEAEGIQDKGLQDNRTKESGSCEPLQSIKNAIELSILLLQAHRKELPDYLCGKDDKKIINEWAVEIEKLIRIDKKSPETIRQVILWVKTPGNFWFHNIQSGGKLRKQYERLYGQMLSDKNQGCRPGGPPPGRKAIPQGLEAL